MHQVNETTYFYPMAFVISIKAITYGSSDYHQTVALRDKILRQPLGLFFTPEQLAAEKDDMHLTIWDKDTLAGCLILQDIDGKRIKMRQVAIDTPYQGFGLGKQLVLHSELLARQNGFPLITCHARKSAVPFYEKLGYSAKGDVFIEVTLPHYYMEKALLNP